MRPSRPARLPRCVHEPPALRPADQELNPRKLNTVASATAPSKTRSRYALVGAGHRAQMYIDAISSRFAGSAELLAWSDTNPGRLDFYDEFMAARDIDSPARYEPSRLPAMISELDIDTVVVTSPDFTHAAVIETCLRAGADVVVEKPLTIDAAGCATDRDRGAGNRPPGDRDLQLPLLAAEQRAEGGDLLRRDRHGDLGEFRVGAGHRARRRLLPAVAPGEGEIRRVVDPQGVTPFRPGELVDR